MSHILIVEDEAVIRSALARLLLRNGFNVSEADSVEQADARFDLGQFDLVVADLRLPGVRGTEIIPRVHPAPVLVMTAYSSVRTAVDAMRKGAVDYIAKPFDHDEMLLVIRRILSEQRRDRQNRALKSDIQRNYPVAGMIGECQAMLEVFEHIRKVAPTDATVLILGESGTGKELVARAIHEASPRRDGPMVAVNCASIPEGLIESELFGHVKGAFTGATDAREGLIEAADGGTLFLDEIGDLPAGVQVRLLRVLQDGEIRRLGASETRLISIRLLAATNRDLRRLADDGQFRKDLYYRLRVMEITLPPLRERGEDTIALARYLLRRSCERLNRPGLKMTADALDRIRAYHWPGNVRELENAIERAAILAESGAITEDLLALDGTQAPHSTPGAPLKLSLDDYFRQFVLDNQGRMSETELSSCLGISRKALWERRKRLGIPRKAG